MYVAKTATRYATSVFKIVIVFFVFVFFVFVKVVDVAKIVVKVVGAFFFFVVFKLIFFVFLKLVERKLPFFVIVLNGFVVDKFFPVVFVFFFFIVCVGLFFTADGANVFVGFEIIDLADGADSLFFFDFVIVFQKAYFACRQSF